MNEPECWSLSNGVSVAAVADDSYSQVVCRRAELAWPPRAIAEIEMRPRLGSSSSQTGSAATARSRDRREQVQR